MVGGVWSVTGDVEVSEVSAMFLIRLLTTACAVPFVAGGTLVGLVFTA